MPTDPLIKGLAALTLGAIGVVSFIRLVSSGRWPPCGAFGDVDGNGKVSQRDADLLEAYQARTLELEDWQLIRANVMQTGVDDPLNVVWIRAYARGEVETFPVCLPGFAALYPLAREAQIITSGLWRQPPFP